MDSKKTNNELTEWIEELISFHYDSESLYIALFSSTGTMLYASKAMKAIIKGQPSENLRNPTFHKLLQSETKDTKVFEGILTIGNGQSFISLNSKIYRKNLELLIIGELDTQELLKQYEVILNLNIEINNLQRQLIKEKLTVETTLKELQESIEKVKILSGLLPICSECKKIRDDKGYWQAVEAYLMEHTDAKFTHGVCPDCAMKLYPKFMEKKKNK